MANVEKSDVYESELEVLIKAAKSQSKNGTIRLAQAVDLIRQKLSGPGKLYSWTPLGVNSVWYLRIPTEQDSVSVEGDPHLEIKKGGEEIVHICKPLKFLEAAEGRDRHRSADFVGYVRDADGAKIEEETFHCVNCTKELPLEIAKKGRLQMALHKMKNGG
tara:strand:+ start:197 stop:679 length:483 start_codon:yes stop_codon:yes gene_type:complete